MIPPEVKRGEEREPFTVSAGICLVKSDLIRTVEILMLRHEDGKWGIPAGGVEQGESPKEAALREFREETKEMERIRIDDFRFLGPIGEYTVFRPNEHPRLGIIYLAEFVKGEIASEKKRVVSVRIPPAPEDWPKETFFSYTYLGELFKKGELRYPEFTLTAAEDLLRGVSTIGTKIVFDERGNYQIDRRYTQIVGELGWRPIEPPKDFLIAHILAGREGLELAMERLVEINTVLPNLVGIRGVIDLGKPRKQEGRA